MVGSRKQVRTPNKKRQHLAPSPHQPIRTASPTDTATNYPRRWGLAKIDHEVLRSRVAPLPASEKNYDASKENSQPSKKKILEVSTLILDTAARDLVVRHSCHSLPTSNPAA
eukprot:scaffold42052_cov48-Cyclotella_meneghiniana.AAC.3